LALKGFRIVCFYRLCMILYIVDLSEFLASEEASQLHKKSGVLYKSCFTKAPVTLSKLVHNAIILI
jgi:hypothetical protein